MTKPAIYKSSSNDRNNPGLSPFNDLSKGQTVQENMYEKWYQQHHLTGGIRDDQTWTRPRRGPHSTDEVKFRHYRLRLGVQQSMLRVVGKNK